MLVSFDEKLKDIALKIKDIAYKLGLIADYVVEYDTEGIWTCRKWASGKAECWGRWSGVVSSYVGPYGSAFYGFNIRNIVFPFTFAELPEFINYTGNIGNTFTMPAQGNLDLKTTGTNLYFLATTSGTQNAYAEIQVKGRWK